MPQPQQHPKKPKQTISVAGLFAKKPHTGREQVASTDGITHKQLSAEEVLTAKAKRHSIYIDVKGTRNLFSLTSYLRETC